MRYKGVLLAMLIVFPSITEAMDIATEHTQLMNYVELITENLRQMQSLENQIVMIKNQVDGLKSVANYQNHFSAINALRNNLVGITNQGAVLSNQTEAILERMQQDLSRMPSSGLMIDQQESLDQNTLDVVHNAINRVAQLRTSYQQAVDSVNDLMDKNDQAVGQTQALQTANQLAAQNIAQMQSTQELLSEQISMQAAMMTKQLQEEKDEDDKLKQIFNAADDGSSMFTTGDAYGTGQH
ncbi:MAG: hypothetical protein KGK03_03010 [Candidatus Omnitrophica bacterium]|nr:hypothetical protein [Candidatus Omnitrophota bacterium]MDE2222021.1 hypothetical protein [Candidatus Omnitrophota bacterium]